MGYGNEYYNENLQGHFNEIHKYFNDYVQYHKENISHISTIHVESTKITVRKVKIIVYRNFPRVSCLNRVPRCSSIIVIEVNLLPMEWWRGSDRSQPYGWQLPWS